MSILAIDPATRLGWAILRDDDRVESGCQVFDLRKGEGPGLRYVRFNAWLVDMKQWHPGLTHIEYEETPGQTRASPQICCGFIAVIQAFSERHQVTYHGTHNGTVKKQFAGYGGAQKEHMIAQCRALGFRPADDNEADAIALLHVVTDRCPLLKPTIPRKGTKKIPPPAYLPTGDPF